MSQTLQEPELVPLDTSDVDRWIGRPIAGEQLKEPIAVNDIRRWVQGMNYPNRLHFDEEFAAGSEFGRMGRAPRFRGASRARTCCSAGTNGGSSGRGSRRET